MQITISTEQARVTVTIMHVTGNIDSITHEQFQTQAKELIAAGTRYILVDLTHSPFVSSAGLRALHDIFKSLRTLTAETGPATASNLIAGAYKSPHLKLLNLSPELQTAFNLSGFHLFIETFNDKQAALASY
jgi:anti-anti-sigma factor